MTKVIFVLFYFSNFSPLITFFLLKCNTFVTLRENVSKEFRVKQEQRIYGHLFTCKKLNLLLNLLFHLTHLLFVLMLTRYEHLLKSFVNAFCWTKNKKAERIAIQRLQNYYIILFNLVSGRNILNVMKSFKLNCYNFKEMLQRILLQLF